MADEKSRRDDEGHKVNDENSHNLIHKVENGDKNMENGGKYSEDFLLFSSSSQMNSGTTTGNIPLSELELNGSDILFTNDPNSASSHRLIDKIILSHFEPEKGVIIKHQIPSEEDFPISSWFSSFFLHILFY